MAMTKIDYILLAETLNEHFTQQGYWPTDEVVAVVKAVARALEANNPKFQWKKFMDAVYKDVAWYTMERAGS